MPPQALCRFRNAAATAAPHSRAHGRLVCPRLSSEEPPSGPSGCAAPAPAAITGNTRSLFYNHSWELFQFRRDMLQIRARIRMPSKAVEKSNSGGRSRRPGTKKSAGADLYATPRGACRASACQAARALRVVFKLSFRPLPAPGLPRAKVGFGYTPTALDSPPLAENENP